jgi:methionyl-tRNA formyltransferase
VLNGQPAIGTGDGLLVLEVVQPEGKRAMDSKAFLNGQADWLDA